MTDSKGRFRQKKGKSHEAASGVGHVPGGIYHESREGAA